MLALFQDISDVSLVGGLRSARHYAVQIANSYDAILASAGRSPQAATEVRTLGIPFLNEVEGPNREIFWRNQNRVGGHRFAFLHSVVTSGERAMRHIPNYRFRQVHEDNYEHGLIFTRDGTPAGGLDATEAVARFTSDKSTTFTYNTEENAYRVRQTWHTTSRDFVDGNNGSRPSFTNVLILKTSITHIPGDGAGRRNVVTTGTGDGYFICGGKYIEIEWHRTNMSSPYYYTLKDGTPLEFGRGTTFICIIPSNSSATFR